MMPIYQTNDYTLHQMKEKNIGKFKPKLNNTLIIHAQMDTNIDRYVYLYTQIL